MQKSILFTLVKSRLGLINPPNGETNPDIGVEDASQYILSDEYINQFSGNQEIEFEFTLPEEVNQDNYYETLTKEYTEMINKITSKLHLDKFLVTVGGDHSISLGSLAAVLKVHNPQTTGVIMIDSHGDIHQPSTSPSGNFHGMWLRPIVDKFEIASLDNLVQQKLPTTHLFYIGNLDIEPAEEKYMKANGIDSFNKLQLNGIEFTNKLERFVNNMEHIHISIDIDAFSKEFAPATGMVIENGLSPNDIFPILKKLTKCKSLSIDLVEVNPKMKGNTETIKFAQELLTSLIKD